MTIRETGEFIGAALLLIAVLSVGVAAAVFAALLPALPIVAVAAAIYWLWWM